MGYRRSRRARAGKQGGQTPLQRFAATIVNLEIVVALALAALCHGGMLFGIEAMTVKTGSMAPAVPAGSMAYVQTMQNTGHTVKEGDIVAFTVGSGENAARVLHRAVSIDASKQTITTKGDANEANDPSGVPFDAVIGKLVGAIPYLGGAIEAFSSHKVAVLAGIVAVNIALIVAASAQAHASHPSRCHARTVHRRKENGESYGCATQIEIEKNAAAFEGAGRAGGRMRGRRRRSRWGTRLSH